MNRARKVLIIEDDPALVRGLKDNFRGEGYQVRTALDGRSGLEALLHDPPDLVVLDLKLPGLSGYDVCRRAKEQNVRSSIIMLSGRTAEDEIVRGFEAGADDYVIKPFSVRELIARAAARCRAAAEPPAEVAHGG